MLIDQPIARNAIADPPPHYEGCTVRPRVSMPVLAMRLLPGVGHWPAVWDAHVAQWDYERQEWERYHDDEDEETPIPVELFPWWAPVVLPPIPVQPPHLNITDGKDAVEFVREQRDGWDDPRRSDLNVKLT